MRALWVVKSPTFLPVETKDSDQSVQMRRLISTFDFYTCQLVLSLCPSSYTVKHVLSDHSKKNGFQD